MAPCWRSSSDCSRCLLPPAYCSLLTAHCLLPTAYLLLLTADCSRCRVTPPLTVSRSCTSPPSARTDGSGRLARPTPSPKLSPR
eukprot:scaffold15905_cov33-Phaeocystis_antarctica.AAC.1